MIQIHSKKTLAGVVLVILPAIVGVLVSLGSGGEAVQVMRKSVGYPRLLSVRPLLEESESCPYLPVNAVSNVAMQELRLPGKSTPTDAARAEVAKRKPLRVIRDPYSAFSAVAVDPTHDEVIMTDENLFSIVTYDRLENTPPRAKMSEPKRIITGMKTNIEFQCSLYVDPSNGDIYAVNNDTLGKLVVFPRNARGNVAPDRYLEAPHTTYGIAMDEANQEMLLTIQDDAAVVVFAKSAKGLASPLRTLQGVRTGLADPHGIAVDPKNDRIFVTNWGSVNVHQAPTSGPLEGTLGRGTGRANWPIGRNYAVPGSGKFMPPSITIYPRTASGDTAPSQVIRGSNTQLNWPTALAFDPERDELYVANDPSHSILVFRADANGNVAPIRVLQGPKTLIRNPTSVHLDLKNDELWVANFGSHSATVYKRTASGDTPPLRVIRSGPVGAPAPMMGNPNALAYDTKREEILVAN